MDHCFEKHTVNLNPSSSQSINSIVFRPIDKYINVLPHLIGSDKWTEKWHVGLLDSDINSHTGSEQYAESIDSNLAPSSSNLNELMIPDSSFKASQNSLVKSSSLIGDQMVINKPGMLFDENEQDSFPDANHSATNFLRPQVAQRKTVNLFDDEPPSLDPSPVAERKPVNLFDDYSSVDSFPEASSKENFVPIPTQQPVDLFNDSEFDDFIKKIENQSGASDIVVQASPKKLETKIIHGQQIQSVNKITEEIKKVQLKKVDQIFKEVVPAITTTAVEKKDPIPKTSAQESKPEKLVKKVESKPLQKKITNIFDDDDEDDYFNAIVKPAEPLETKPLTAKTKLSNLFEDEDNDNIFGEIFIKNPTANPVQVPINKPSSLYDDESQLFLTAKPETIKQETSNLFAEDVESNIPKKLSELIKTNAKAKPSLPEAPVSVDGPENTLETYEELNPKAKVESKDDGNPENVEDNSIIEEVETSSSTVIKSDSKPPREEGRVTESSIQLVDKLQSAMPEFLHHSFNDGSPKVFQSAKEEHPQHILRSTLPLLIDVPPEDNESWETEDNYEESEQSFRPKSLNYPVVPIFNDVPPDDDFGFSSAESPPAELVSEDEDETIPSNVIQIASIEKSENIQDQQSNKDDANDELDRSVPVSIKSKLDIFNRKAEDTLPADMTKKPLPGKLNNILKINVEALLPAARLLTSEAKVHPDDLEFFNNFAHSSSDPLNADPNNNSMLLNNELVKSRARILVKRQPSTRRGRKANYQRRANDTITENMIDTSDEKRHTLSEKPQFTVVPRKNVSIFGDDYGDISNRDKQIKIETQMPPNEPAPKVVTTNKISVFYDDEHDTRVMVEQRKLEQRKLKSIQKSSIGQFDPGEGNDFLEKSSTPILENFTSKVVQSLFYEESDDDFFPEKQQAEPVIRPPVQNIKTSLKATQSDSLFDDDHEDDLFSNVKKKSSVASAGKSSKLFESDDETDPFSIGSNKPSNSKMKQSKKQSLFGDDESDNDDLFSSNVKCKNLFLTILYLIVNKYLIVKFNFSNIEDGFKRKALNNCKKTDKESR